MVTWGHCRLLALVIVIFWGYLVMFSPFVDKYKGAYLWFAVVDIYLYSHYILAFANPSVFRQFKSLARIRHGQLFLSVLFLVSVASVIYEPELTFLFFAFHFAVSEVYSRFLFDKDRGFFIGADKLKKIFRAVHIVFLSSLFLYGFYGTLLFVEKMHLITELISQSHLLFVAIASGVIYFGFLLSKKNELFPEKSKKLIFYSYFIPEILFVFVALISAEQRIHWSAAVFYHIVFWTFFPFVRAHQSARWRPLVFNTLLPTLGITLFFIAIFPGFMEGEPSTTEFLASVGYSGPLAPFNTFFPDVINQDMTHSYIRTMEWGIFHIVFSVALSTLNPLFFRRLSTPDKSDPWQA